MPKNVSYRQLLLVIVALLIAVNVAIVAIKMRRQRDLPEVPTGIAAFPKARDRVGRQIDTLSEESLELSIERLGDVNMYFWPGPLEQSPVSATGFPIPGIFAHRDADTIMSNRRVLKVFDELSALPENDAVTLISRELTTALAEYQQLFDDYIKKMGGYFRAGAQVQAGPPFIVGGVRTGKPTLVGAKLRVLALVFLAGNLELKELGPSVLHFAQVARQQYLQWSQEEDYLLIFNSELLRKGGLYSRHVLGVGLIGTAGDTPQENALLDKYKKRIHRHKLTRFDAIVTRYDMNARMGAAQVDYSDGLTLWTVSPLSDDEIVDIIEGRRKIMSLQ